VLNLGLNDRSTAGLAARTRDARIAGDCYRCLVQMFGNVVREIAGERSEDEIARVVAGHLRGSGLVSQMTAIGHAADSSTIRAAATELCGPAEIPRVRAGPECRFSQRCWPEEAVIVFEQPGGD
jgi:hypothetical protein